MQYHAHALAVHGADVDLIGYRGAPLPKLLTADPRVTVHRLPVDGTTIESARSSTHR